MFQCYRNTRCWVVYDARYNNRSESLTRLQSTGSTADHPRPRHLTPLAFVTFQWVRQLIAIYMAQPGTSRFRHWHRLEVVSMSIPFRIFVDACILNICYAIPHNTIVYWLLEASHHMTRLIKMVSKLRLRIVLTCILLYFIFLLFYLYFQLVRLHRFVLLDANIFGMKH